MITIDIEEPLRDVYTWRAVYEDGTTCVGENEDNSFADVDKARTRTLYLISLVDDSFHHVDIPFDASPVFFRRRSVEINPMSGKHNHSATVHCIGWQSDEDAEYHFVFADGSVLKTNDFQAV